MANDAVDHSPAGGADAKFSGPHDTLDVTVKTAMGGGLAGLFVASVKNALSTRAVGPMTVFTKGAPIIGLCAAAPATYAFVSRSVMNLREKDDAFAAGLGGFFGGVVMALPLRRFPPVIGAGAFLATWQTVFVYGGGRLDSWRREEDEFERKEIMRRTTRVPIEQVVADIGEGRGIEPPGYEERRRERIKEKYGFDVDPVSATVEGST